MSLGVILREGDGSLALRVWSYPRHSPFTFSHMSLGPDRTCHAICAHYSGSEICLYPSQRPSYSSVDAMHCSLAVCKAIASNFWYLPEITLLS